MCLGAGPGRTPGSVSLCGLTFCASSRSVSCGLHTWDLYAQSDIQSESDSLYSENKNKEVSLYWLIG